MNKRDFTFCMKCGSGRCQVILENNKNIEKFRAAVLYGCLTPLSYDEQCEGTRGAYIYRLARCFNDDEYFVIPASEKFSGLSSDCVYYFTHLADLLFCFADNGNKTAAHALEQKYKLLLSEALTTRRSMKLNRILDNFEYLCICISDLNDDKQLLKVSENLGEIFIHLKKDGIEKLQFHFIWFFQHSDKKLNRKSFRKKLDKLAETSDAVKMFIDVLNFKKPETFHTKTEPLPAEEIISRITSSENNSVILPARLRRHLFKNPETKIQTEQAVVAECDENKKAALLRLFCSRYCVFSLDPSILINYTKSQNTALQSAAFDSLSYIKNPAVHDFAAGLIMQNKNDTNALELLITNFQPEDAEVIFRLLKSLPVSYNEYKWHSAVLSIIDQAYENVKFPLKILMYIYEHSLCSCCRARVLEIMKKQKMLSEDILYECTFDSNEDIREFAEKLKKSPDRLKSAP